MAVKLDQIPLKTLIEEVEEISEGLYERLIVEEVDYESFYAKQEALLRRVNEILNKPLDQRINYYIYLDTQMCNQVKIENFEAAEELKQKKEYFRISYLDRMPLERLEPHCHSR